MINGKEHIGFLTEYTNNLDKDSYSYKKYFKLKNNLSSTLSKKKI
jgi:hypothetical protein